MVPAEVNWRLAVYVGGLVGGLLWAVLIGTALNETDSGAIELTSVNWWRPIMVSATVLIVGAAASMFARSIVSRSLGIGLMVGALSGWTLIIAVKLWVV
jgi:hypothetical protein